MRRVTAVSTPVAHLVGPGKLKVINGHLAFTAEGQGALRLDPQALRTLLCYGPVGMTDEAVRLLLHHEIQVAWLTPAGTQCKGRLVQSDPSTTTLRLLQHQALARPDFQLDWARRIVLAKVQAQMTAARHYQRHGAAEAGPVLGQLEDAAGRCAAATTLEQVRGLEGTASAAWFRLLGQLLRPPWRFGQRVRRPPTDPVNALLSLGYTWVLTRTVARCEAAGLEVNLGGLHEYRPGRPSLACDLMEPLRVPAVDRWVVHRLNQGEMTPADFVAEEGGIRLHPKAFGRSLMSWEDHWLNDGHERALDELLAELVALLRQWGTRLPPPADGLSAVAL
jgi:CRISPR-associated protein Cas1